MAPIDLDDAYSLDTPDDSRRLYAKWASSYDDEFIDAYGYVYDANVAAAFVEAGGKSPVLDVGCGTGAVGVALRALGVDTVDGIDISPEMLAVAEKKGAYRSLLVADLTEPLEIGDHTYGGIVSVGTFTHGHLSPEPLRELVRTAAPNAVCAIGINAEHFVEMGFDALFTELVNAGTITTPVNHQVPIYEDRDHDHGDDLATVAVFTVLG